MTDRNFRPFYLRLYKLLLFLYPPSVRARFGRDMQECFADLLTRASRNGGALAVLRVVARTVLETPRSAIAAYRSPAKRMAHRSAPFAHSKKREMHMDTLLRDIRFTLRGFRRRPAFAILAVLSLAIGVGANTTMFSTVNAVLWQPLPVPQPERLVRVYEHQDGYSTLSYPNFNDISEQVDVFSGTLLHRLETFGLANDGASEVVHGEIVSANYFQVLGLNPTLGQFFTLGESGNPGDALVAVLGHDLWTRSFGADPDVIGRTIRLNDHPATIVAVAPRDFNGTKFGLGMDLWVPVKIWANLSSWGNWTERRGSSQLNMVARLTDGVTVEQAQLAVSAVATRLAQEFPGTNREMGFAIFPEQTLIPDIGDLPRLIGLLAVGTSSLVLLVACANVASLLFARALARNREVGVRLALGASRNRLVRQFLTEATILAIMGGAVGTALSFWTSRFIYLFLPSLPYRFAIDTTPDARVLGFAAAISLTASFVFGLLPALKASRQATNAVVKSGIADTGVNVRTGRAFDGVVVTMVTLSFVTLFLSALFTRSLSQVRSMDPGFIPQQRVFATFDVALAGQDRHQGRLFYEQLLARTTGLPGVQNAALASIVPLADRSSASRVYVDDRTYGLDELGEVVWRTSVSDDYFATMGTPVLRGRTFDNRDNEDSQLTVVINQLLADQLWPTDDPVGRRLRFTRTSDSGITLEVIGVVGTGRYLNMGETPRGAMFVSIAQSPATYVTLIAHADNPLSLVSPIRSTAASIDPSVPMFDVKSIEAHLAGSLWMFRMGAGIGGALGLLALALAAGGLYGIMSYSVNQRVRELGIRIALGAKAGQVLSLVLRRGFVLVSGGLVLGLVGAIAISKTLTNMLFGVSPTDPFTLVAVAILLSGVAMAATLLPARSATRADPANALRSE